MQRRQVQRELDQRRWGVLCEVVREADARLRTLDGEGEKAFQMRFEDCRWKVCDPAVLARERYEGATVVKAVKRFTRQATFDGTHAASYEDFRAWADSCGLCVGVNQRETRRQLEQYAAQLAQYDGIHLSLDKRVGSKRGFAVVEGTTDD